jgi:ribosome-binding factor A
MKLRHTPELRFILDDSISQGSETLSLIRSLELPPEESPEGSDSE